MAETIAETCAVRGLRLRRPLEVLPMAAFEGGYTPGIGSVVWRADHAAKWRRGWCALGVYCAASEAGAGAAARGDERSPLGGPRGLYDPERAALYLAAGGKGVPASTIAHETTHALQLQNYPQLAAIHLWHNRDLAAAANAALEGDAHIVGWAFDATRRLALCSLDPDHAWRAGEQRRWGWRPDTLWAHEGFPHVFGPRLALERQLAAGNDGANALLRAPPLSTRHVLAPETPPGATFIDLTVDLEDDALAKRGCELGLANTAGAVGIWGLLLAHGAEGVSAEAPPDFLAAWQGDRFVHLPCAGAGGDELAWLTQWRSADAAREFARRYRGIAAEATSHGGVLGAVPTATQQGEQVLVATSGLRPQHATLLAAPRRTFDDYAAWTAAHCFPQERCDEAPTVPASPGTALQCDEGAVESQSSRLADWLQQIRLARGRRTQTSAAARTAIGTHTGQLAAFCVRNSVGNADLALACRAVVQGIRHWRGWQADGNWRLLPHCAGGVELKQWLRDGYQRNAPRPFASAATFPDVYGAAFVAAAAADVGIARIEQLATNPPLSTGHLLGLPPTPVAFAEAPEAALAEAGCTVSATDVRGPLGIWSLLLDHGSGFGEEAPPPLLADWRGDRLFYLRCGEASGWIWASHWRHRQAARQFEAEYATLAATVAETGLTPGRPWRRGRTVWVAPEALGRQLDVLASRVQWRRLETWGDWLAAGCPPQAACRGEPPAPGEERGNREIPPPSAAPP